MLKKLSTLAKTKAASFLIYWLVRSYCAALRVRIENESEWFDYLKKGGRVLLCCWHQQFFIGVRIFGKYRKFAPALMSSRSKDGQMGAGVAQRAGCHTVWGSSTRGGGSALKEMIKRIRETRLAVHMIDGPQGPAGVVKAGVIAMAHGANAALVPVCVRSDRAWYLKSWDAFMIPKPFARVTVSFSSPVELPKAKDKANLEEQRQMLENIMRPCLYRRQ